MCYIYLMDKWNIQLNRHIQDFILSQDIQSQAEIMQSIKLLSEYGLALGIPHVKPLDNKIYELRVKTKDKGYRLLYFAYINKTFVFTHGFIKKTQKTPRKNIDLAIKRMNIFIKGENEK